ncbi:transmembrane protein G1P-related 1 [Forsythia ovata]|uniref:Transmembrane protein G1P-related 1 n=1 Tax=Forsythia ovata TaxID=205694 RepID=A0ABD1NU20_9LAMI
MASRFTSHLLLRHRRHPQHQPLSLLRRHFTNTSTTVLPKPHPLYSLLKPHEPPIITHLRQASIPFNLRFLSTRPYRANKPDIGARARQLQNRRLWTYALTFSCIAGFIVIVLNQFQDQLVFYITPTDALQKYNSNPGKSKFRLGGLVLENSVAQLPSSPETQFVITDLITDILVKYEGSLPDLFREGHSVVVEGFIKPFDEEIRKKEEGILRNSNKLGITEKARSLECYFSATEVLAKHDEKYMPAEVATAIEKNKKKLIEEEKSRGEALYNAKPATNSDSATA